MNSIKLKRTNCAKSTQSMCNAKTHSTNDLQIISALFMDFVYNSKQYLDRSEDRNLSRITHKKWLTAHKIIHAYQEHNLVKGR